MKLEEYLKKKFEEHNINIELYVKEQNINLLNFIAKREKIEDKKNFIKKYLIEPKIEDILNKLFYEEIYNQWKQNIILNYKNDPEDVIYILLEFIKIIFKNKTDIILDKEMDFQITPEEFEDIYKKVFMPHYNMENKSRMKQKKFRLKNKLCKGCVNKEKEDYEIILFKFIVNNPI